MRKYIWLFGENLGKTSNNNSFYFWKEINTRQDEVRKFFIMAKNKENKKHYKSLDRQSRKNVIWKNSFKHWKYYKKSSLCFVTLSYKDIQPSKFIIKKTTPAIASPIVYLQHGTLGMKKVGYQGKSYNNNMFRFIYYNKNIKDILIKENNFKPYQLKYSEYHPRYKELVIKNEEYKKESKNKKSILWFITWRDYFGDNKETEKFIDKIKSTINNYKLNKFLQDEDYNLKICLHQFFDKEKIKYMTSKLENNNIKIITPDKVDVMEEIAKNDILITDYSSLAFDFTLLEKPVILYQPDINIYSKYRDFYYLEEMKKYAITKPNTLVTELMQNRFKVNPFFKEKMPNNIDYEYIKQGKHIEKLYNYFYNIQINNITFIGYNFFGRGGTVSATLALAEGLLENNYLVKLISLKKTSKNANFPNGLYVRAFYYSKSKSIKTKIKKLLFYYKKKKIFPNDPNRQYLIPYAEFALKRRLNTIVSNTVVSTRESLHTYLKQAKSKNIKNKIYFFHTDYKVLKEQFKGLIEILKNTRLEKVAFVTNNAKENYEQKLGYNNYEHYEIIENCLDSTRMIEKKDIQPIKNKNKYDAIYLLRISKDRIEDINNLVGFAEFLKENKNNTVRINVYGIGDYVEEFEDIIKSKKLQKYIKYHGLTTEVSETIRMYDCMIDFSLNHTFGMTYIEAILNGKVVFAMKNAGSQEVLNEIPDAFVASYKDLLDKVNNLKNVNLDRLKKNYDIIQEKYSREKISSKFINYINKTYDIK